MDIFLCVTSAVRIERLSDAARTNQDALRGTQAEITEYRRQLQSRTIELETLRGTQESLERQRIDSEDRHQDDLNSLQAGMKKNLVDLFCGKAHNRWCLWNSFKMPACLTFKAVCNYFAGDHQSAGEWAKKYQMGDGKPT